MSAYQHVVPQLSRLLDNLNKSLDKAVAYAKTKNFDPNVLVSQRLAPDMYPLAKQIQVTSDNIKGAAARLTGNEPPKYEDNEKTIDELKERLTKTQKYLNSFKPADFDGCEDRRVTLPWAPGKYMVGGEYLVELLIPNVYFHASMAYAILRHNGVDLSKTDFIGNINIRS